MTLHSIKPIRTGDYIEVEHRDQNGEVDLLIRGTALTDLSLGGSSLFSIIPSRIEGMGSRQLDAMHLNCNFVDVKLLYSAPQPDQKETR